jgi:hypothetical protein
MSPGEKNMKTRQGAHALGTAENPAAQNMKTSLDVNCTTQNESGSTKHEIRPDTLGTVEKESEPAKH